MKRSVIGIGSPFGGDRAGWLVVEQLQKTDGIDYQTLDRPGVALLEVMRGYDQVVLVDAVLMEEGGVVVLDRQQVLARCRGGLSSHAAGVQEVVALGVALNELPQQFWLVGVGMVAPNEEPPPQLLEEAAQQVLALL